jgi:enoyl-CoA hydratase
MVMLDHEPVVVTRDEENIAVLTISRPEALNALNPDVLRALERAVKLLEEDPEVRVCIITGDGHKAFVAGADVRLMSELGPGAIADFVEIGQRTLRSLERSRFPVLACVDGFALGGGLELALACDLIVAEPEVKLGQPEINLGILPGFGGTQRLTERCGVGTARRLCFTGDLLSGEEGFRLGIVDVLAEKGEAFAECMKIARQLASKAPLALKETKRVINESRAPLLLQGLRREVEAFLDLFATKDREEGMTAFLQKRKPSFTGR